MLTRLPWDTVIEPEALPEKDELMTGRTVSLPIKKVVCVLLMLPSESLDVKLTLYWPMRTGMVKELL